MNSRKIVLIVMMCLSLCFSGFCLMEYLNNKMHFLTIISGLLFFVTFLTSYLRIDKLTNQQIDSL